MDQAMKYADILTRVIREEAKFQPSIQPIKIVSACDRETGEFLLISFGYENKQRIDNILFHARLIDEKVIIETDNIEEGLMRPLIEAGIPPEDIAYIWTIRRQESKPAAA